MSDICLDVEVRENTGTGAARTARRSGAIPGVIYGGDLGAISIELRHNEVMRALNSGNFLSNMIEISHKGEKQKVITKDVQFHPVTDLPVHVDLYRVTAASIIEVEVSVTILGEDVSPGIKRGGSLNVVRHAIEVKCPAGSIPDTIEVDISEMDIGDSLHISDITLPTNVTPTIDDRDFTIATIASSRAAEPEEAVDAEIGAEGAAEGEDAATDAGADE